LDDRWDSVIDSLDRKKGYVIYCSGDECELSLFLGRYMNTLGFNNIFIFYGGWREWVENDLPVVGQTGDEG
jgi:3-mercaptopyruvate sulfurtransferase SseA